MGEVEKTYNAKCVGDDSVAAVQHQATSHGDESLAMGLVNPVPNDTQTLSPCKETQPALISRKEQLADIAAGLEARILCRFTSIKDWLAKMQADMHYLQSQCSRKPLSWNTRCTFNTGTRYTGISRITYKNVFTCMCKW